MKFRLRLLEPGDALLYRRLYTDPEVMEHLGGPLDRATADACFRTLMGRRGRGDRYYAAITGANDVSCGIGAIVSVPDEACAAELGVMLLPGHWHRGLGKAVLRALADVAFASSTCQCLRVQYARSNSRLERLATRVGFETTLPNDSNRDAAGNISAWLRRPD